MLVKVTATTIKTLIKKNGFTRFYVAGSKYVVNSHVNQRIPASADSLVAFDRFRDDWNYYNSADLGRIHYWIIKR